MDIPQAIAFGDPNFFGGLIYKYPCCLKVLFYLTQRHGCFENDRNFCVLPSLTANKEKVCDKPSKPLSAPIYKISKGISSHLRQV